MLRKLIQYLKECKSDFVSTLVLKEGYTPSWTDTDSCTYWPSTWDEKEVQELDIEALWRAIESFEDTFKEGGENAERNPLNTKEKESV